jgi:hypothetical protein
MQFDPLFVQEVVIGRDNTRRTPAFCPFRRCVLYHLYVVGAIAQHNLGFAVPEDMNVRRFVIIDKDDKAQSIGSQDDRHQLKVISGASSAFMPTT